MKPILSYKGLLKEFEKVNSIVAGDTAWIAKALLYQISRNEKYPRSRRKQPMRKLSAYNVFMSEGLKAGKPFKQIVDEWNAQKQAKC